MEKRHRRQELSRVLNDVLRPGNTLVVWKLDHLARSLIRHGNHLRTLVDQFNIKPVEIKAFSTGTLNAERTRELTEIMKEAGVPA